MSDEATNLQKQETLTRRSDRLVTPLTNFTEGIEETWRADAGWNRAHEAEAKLEAAYNAIRFASAKFDRVSRGWDGDCGLKDIIATLEDILPENVKVMARAAIDSDCKQDAFGALPCTNCSRRCSPQLSGSETTAFREVIVGSDQDVIWTRDAQNNVIGYTITNPKPVAGMTHILDDGRLSALDVQMQFLERSSDGIRRHLNSTEGNDFMIHENTDTPLKADCPSAPRSALEFLAQELDMPVEHIREAAKAIREENLAKTADELHGAIFTMLSDWRDGDFNLPPLAKSHMEGIEVKAVELGKVLFRRQNAEVRHGATDSKPN